MLASSCNKLDGYACELLGKVVLELGQADESKSILKKACDLGDESACVSN